MARMTTICAACMPGMMRLWRSGKQNRRKALTRCGPRARTCSGRSRRSTRARGLHGRRTAIPAGMPIYSRRKRRCKNSAALWTTAHTGRGRRNTRLENRRRDRPNRTNMRVGLRSRCRRGSMRSTRSRRPHGRRTARPGMMQPCSRKRRNSNGRRTASRRGGCKRRGTLRMTR